MNIVSDEGKQPPLFVEVRMIMIGDASVSVFVGRYDAPNVLSFGINAPEPFGVVQVPVPLPPTIDPPNPTGLFAHATTSAPADAVGGGVMVRVKVSTSARQVPLPVEVSTSVMLPPAMSAASGT